MTSGWTARAPYFTVASNSVDRLIRLRAGTPAKEPDVAIRQITRGGPYGAGWTRSNARRGSASASGSHARGLGAGYSARRSVCPWPRHSPRWSRIAIRSLTVRNCDGSWVDRRVVLLLAGAVP